MRYSFATVVLAPRGGRADPPSAADRARILDWARSAGFSGVEISPRWYDVLSHADAQVRSFGQEVRDAGLVVSGINLNRGILTRTPHAGRHRADAERAVDVAAILDTGIVNLSLAMPTLPTPDRPPLRGRDVPDEEFARSAEIVAVIARRAAGRGVTLALDLHDDGLLDTADAMLRFLDRVGELNVGVNPDIGNVCRGPDPLPDWRTALARLAPRAANWHVKNYRDFQAAPLADGDIDYAEVVAAMRHVGYRGWVSIESYYGDVCEVQRSARAYLQQLATREADPA